MEDWWEPSLTVHHLGLPPVCELCAKIMLVLLCLQIWVFSLFLVWTLLSLQSPALGVILFGLSLWSDWNRNNTLSVASACTVSSTILNVLWITAYHCHRRQHPYFTDENGWVFPHWHMASEWRRLSTRAVHGTTGLHCTSWSFIEEMGGLWVKAY